MPCHDGHGASRQQVAFTIPYYREGVGLLLKKGGKYAGYAALKAAGSAVTVSVLQNVYAEDMVHQALPGVRTISLIGRCCSKCARRIRPIMSTPIIPLTSFQADRAMEATLTHSV